ncbi:helix-turn-helix transcriptional regulator [Streptomyces sp. H10-C2]|nr:helix-turn-helix transcriptional regulator [Streptomyces sp. H10-C2]MDJ0372615.1 helix-turn-helix transcriptional regulator [Streptomyces sp. H10-C2]
MGLRVNPTYRQRRFGAEVRRLRERAGLSSTEAASLLGMKQPQLSNVEVGKTGLFAERVQRLAEASGVSASPFIEALIELGQDSGKGWWSEYRKLLGAPHLDLAELETSAVRLGNYEPMFIPGLLQTQEYAAVLHRDGYAKASEEEQSAAVEFRMRRQKLLTGERAPHLHAIIHEAALSLSLGDRAVMRGQLLRLIEMSRLPNVTIQILPFDGRVGFGTGFVVIEPRVSELATAVVSHIEQSLYLEESDSIAKYNGWFAKLGEDALPPVDAAALPEARVTKDSIGLIERILYPLL